MAVAEKQRKIVEHNADGTQTIKDPVTGAEVRFTPQIPEKFKNGIPKQVHDFTAPSTPANGAASGASEEYESPFAKRLKQLEVATTTLPPINKVEVEGDPEPWFILRGDLGHISTQAAWASRDASGRLSTAQDARSVYVGFLAAMLYVYVMCEDGSRFFPETKEGWAEAYSMAASNETLLMRIADGLGDHILELNPLILPDSAAPSVEELKAMIEAEKKESSGDEASEPSLTPPTTPPLNSLKEMDGSDAPATWQSDVGCSASTLEATPQSLKP